MNWVKLLTGSPLWLTYHYILDKKIYKQPKHERTVKLLCCSLWLPYLKLIKTEPRMHITVKLLFWYTIWFIPMTYLSINLKRKILLKKNNFPKIAKNNEINLLVQKLILNQKYFKILTNFNQIKNLIISVKFTNSIEITEITTRS